MRMADETKALMQSDRSLAPERLPSLLLNKHTHALAHTEKLNLTKTHHVFVFHSVINIKYF